MSKLKYIKSPESFINNPAIKVIKAEGNLVIIKDIKTNKFHTYRHIHMNGADSGFFVEVPIRHYKRK